MYPWVVARKNTLELHYIKVAGEEYLMDVFSNGLVPLKKFRFKKLKMAFLPINKKRKALNVLQNIMDDGYHILNIETLNQKIGLRLQNTYDMEDVLKRDRLEIHYLTIGNNGYLSDVYSNNKINLKPYGFKLYPVQYWKFKNKQKAFQHIEQLLQGGITILNLKALKKKLGFFKMSSFEDLQAQAVKYSNLSKKLLQRGKVLLPKLEKAILLKKDLLRRSSNDQALLADHNRLVLLRNDFSDLLKDFIESIKDSKIRLTRGENLDFEDEKEKLLDLSKAYKTLRVTLELIKRALKEV